MNSQDLLTPQFLSNAKAYSKIFQKDGVYMWDAQSKAQYHVPSCPSCRCKLCMPKFTYSVLEDTCLESAALLLDDTRVWNIYYYNTIYEINRNSSWEKTKTLDSLIFVNSLTGSTTRVVTNDFFTNIMAESPELLAHRTSIRPLACLPAKFILGLVPLKLPKFQIEHFFKHYKNNTVNFQPL
jgi:hypothetical protein